MKKQFATKLAETIKSTIQDSHLNFLIGSGASANVLFKTLGNLEKLITAVYENKHSLADGKFKNMLASLYYHYFKIAMQPNMAVLANDSSAEDLKNRYTLFFNKINKILLERKTNLLNKQASVFTTNIDMCMEKYIESCGFEYIDGFNGKINPTYDTSNFNKSLYKRSLQYNNKSEIPLFNLIKLHGSVSWNSSDKRTIFSDYDLKLVSELSKITPPASLLTIDENTVYDDLLFISDVVDPVTESFLDSYEKLSVVNPTKQKLEDTILNQTYYDLLRIYANTLEKENSVLFVIGFSFSDEHVRQITIRAANSNPTLQVYIFAYNSASAENITSIIGDANNNNITVISPKINDEIPPKDVFQFSLDEITRKVFVFNNNVTPKAK